MKRELKHDILAEKIWERLPEQDKRLRQVKSSLERRHTDYRNGGSLLGLKDLAAWEDLIPKLDLKPEILDFIEESRVFRENEAAQKLNEERRKRRWAIWAAIIGFTLAGLAAWQSWVAQEAQKVAEQKTEEVEQEKATSDSLTLVAQDSSRALALQRNEADSLRIAAETALADLKREQIQKLTSQATAFLGEERFADAIQAYREALEKVTDSTEKQRLTALLAKAQREQTKHAFERNRDIGLRMQAAGYCQGALGYLKKAETIEPNNEAIQNAIQACEQKIPTQ